LLDMRAKPATRPDGGGYLERLETEWRREVVALASAEALLPLVERAVGRCAEGQRRTHAAAGGEVEELRHWAESLESPPGYRWWEIAAGASSSVAAHALIAAAADPRTTAEAAALIDAAYHPPIGALTVILDDLVDRDEDLAGGEHNYLAYYEGPEAAAECMALIADRAEALVKRLPDANRHRAILAGVVGFYLSAPTAKSGFAQPIRARLLEALGHGARLPATFMRARRLGERIRPEQAGNSPGP
jgi:tetraprenyl-beta-curcumene synthase